MSRLPQLWAEGGAGPRGLVGFAVDEDGLPHLPARGVRVTGELVSRLLDEEDA